MSRLRRTGEAAGTPLPERLEPANGFGGEQRGAGGRRRTTRRHVLVDEPGGYVRVNDWNQYFIMARGGTFIHVINGQLMAAYVDDDPDSSNNRPGRVGIEVEGTPTVSVRNVWMKKLN